MHDSIFTRSNSRKENPATECIVCGDPTFRGTDYCIDCLKNIRKTEIEIQGLFNDKIASYSEDTFEFFRGARERALARFMEEARVFSMSCSVVPDRLNMSAADQFDAIVAGTHKDLSEKNSNFLCFHVYTCKLIGQCCVCCTCTHKRGRKNSGYTWTKQN